MKRIMFAVMLIIVIVCTTVIVKSESDIKLMCDNGGDFTILVVSDPQCDTKTQWEEARNELENLIKKCNPDFVLINGDMNSYGKIPVDMWDMFITPITSRNIYWSTTNGNHDPFNKTHYRMYKSYSYCLNDTVNTTDINYQNDRPMNYVLPIYSNDGKKIVFAIYGMDSGTAKTDGYEGLSKKQINWYITQSSKLKQQNGGRAVTSILCMHIPMPQMLEMYYGKHGDVYGVANEQKYNNSGYTCQDGSHIPKINVHTSAVAKDNNMFEAILNQGDIKSVLFGHNHCNNFIGSYKGVLLGFVGKLSTGCYSDTLCRGGRVIKFNQSNPSAFTTEWIGAINTSLNQPQIYSDGTLKK